MPLSTTTLEWVPTGSLRPYARTHPKAQVRRLDDGIAGHGRLASARQGATGADTHRTAGVSPALPSDLSGPVGLAPDAGETPAVQSPAPMWTLGRHRLACGDAADPKVLARLLDGDRVDLVMGEPPADAPDARQAIADVLRAVAPHAAPAAAAIVYAHVRQLVTLVRAGASSLVDPARGRSLPRMPALAMLLHAQSCPLPELGEVLVACTPEDALVLDPFARTDATLAAAHESGRTARLLCADIATCRAIAERWGGLSLPR